MIIYDELHDLFPTKDSTVTTAGRHTYPLTNIILRSIQEEGTVYNWKACYFDQNGTYSKLEYCPQVPDTKPPFIQSMRKLCAADGERFSFIDGKYFMQTCMQRAINNLMPEDDISHLGELYNKELAKFKASQTPCIVFNETKSKEELQNRKKRMKERGEQIPKNVPFEVSQFVQKINRPTIERSIENKNKKTFDFVRIFIGIPHTWYMDKREFLKQNKRPIFRMVLDTIKNDKKYQKYNIPINFLKLTSCTITCQDEIEMVFELKLQN